MCAIKWGNLLSTKKSYVWKFGCEILFILCPVVVEMYRYSFDLTLFVLKIIRAAGKKRIFNQNNNCKELTVMKPSSSSRCRILTGLFTSHKQYAFPFLPKNSYVQGEPTNKQEIKQVKYFNIIIPILVCLLYQLSVWICGPLVKYCEMFEDVSCICLWEWISGKAYFPNK